MGVYIAAPTEPFRYRRRSIEGSLTPYFIERVEGKVVCMSMRQQDRVESRERGHGNSRITHAREKATKSLVKIGIG
jgi:hypothetical protein